jgi:hypothetical protein
MQQFTARLTRYNEKGEKSGWTFILIPEQVAKKLQPGRRTSFRVKGKLDTYVLKQVALLPVGEGRFILPVNAPMRRAIHKKEGDTVKVSLQTDDTEFVMSADFITCLEDDPKAKATFLKQPGSHQRYFSKWIESAKTAETKARRIAQCLEGLAMGMNYGEIMRYFKAKKM